MIVTPSPETPSRPVPLTAGVIAIFASFLAIALSGYFWVLVYQSLLDVLPPEATSDPELDDVLIVYRTFLIIIVIIMGLFGVAMAGGAALAMNGKNVGRILIWVFGGITVAWHMCCSGYTLLMRAVMAQAIAESNAKDGTDFDVNDHFPMWQIDAAVVAGFAAAVAALVAVILIAQRSVNEYFRALKPPPAFPPPQYGPPPGPPQYGPPQW